MWSGLGVGAVWVRVWVWSGLGVGVVWAGSTTQVYFAAVMALIFYVSFGCLKLIHVNIKHTNNGHVIIIPIITILITGTIL